MDITTLFDISYGVYVVSSKKGEKHNGQIANVVTQVTSEPPKILVCLNKKNLTHNYITESNVFSVSILEKETPLKLIGTFGFRSGREFDKFKEVGHKTGKKGIPYLTENTLGYLLCEVTESLDVGTHTAFVGKLTEAEKLKQGEPLTYSYYHEVKKGKTDKNAPTYVKENPEKKEKTKMKSYRCTVCGYIYEPEQGDPDNGVEPGTAFEDIPDDWVCPVCGASKDEFEPV